MILFLGPIVWKVQNWSPQDDVPDFTRSHTWRNIVVGPLAEEWVFRASMVPFMIQAGFSPFQAIVITPIFFALAHVHHIFRVGWQQTRMIHFFFLKTRGLAFYRYGPILTSMLIVLQVGYTSVFGLIGAFLQVRTGHFIAPALAHIFCNYMGLPDLDFQYHKRKNLYWLLYAIGLVGFFVAAGPLTDPTLHNSVYYNV
jgi:prenyl protein peptidase